MGPSSSSTDRGMAQEASDESFQKILDAKTRQQTSSQVNSGTEQTLFLSIQDWHSEEPSINLLLDESPFNKPFDGWLNAKQRTLEFRCKVPAEYPGRRAEIPTNIKNLLSDSKVLGITTMYIGSSPVKQCMDILKKARSRRPQWSEPVSLYDAQIFWMKRSPTSPSIYIKMVVDSDEICIMVVNENSQEYKNEFDSNVDKFIQVIALPLRIKLRAEWWKGQLESYTAATELQSPREPETQSTVPARPEQRWWWPLMQAQRDKQDKAKVKTTEESDAQLSAYPEREGDDSAVAGQDIAVTSSPSSLLPQTSSSTSNKKKMKHKKTKKGFQTALAAEAPLSEPSEAVLSSVSPPETFSSSVSSHQHIPPSDTVSHDHPSLHPGPSKRKKGKKSKSSRKNPASSSDLSSKQKPLVAYPAQQPFAGPESSARLSGDKQPAKKHKSKSSRKSSLPPKDLSSEQKPAMASVGTESSEKLPDDKQTAKKTTSESSRESHLPPRDLSSEQKSAVAPPVQQPSRRTESSEKLSGDKKPARKRKSNSSRKKSVSPKDLSSEQKPAAASSVQQTSAGTAESSAKLSGGMQPAKNSVSSKDLSSEQKPAIASAGTESSKKPSGDKQPVKNSVSSKGLSSEQKPAMASPVQQPSAGTESSSSKKPSGDKQAEKNRTPRHSTVVATGANKAMGSGNQPGKTAGLPQIEAVRPAVEDLTALKEEYTTTPTAPATLQGFADVLKKEEKACAATTKSEVEDTAGKYDHLLGDPNLDLSGAKNKGKVSAPPSRVLDPSSKPFVPASGRPTGAPIATRHTEASGPRNPVQNQTQPDRYRATPVSAPAAAGMVATPGSSTTAQTGWTGLLGLQASPGSNLTAEPSDSASGPIHGFSGAVAGPASNHAHPSDASGPWVLCGLAGCDTRCNLWDGKAVICPQCGPHAGVRYCSQLHLHEDVKLHWGWCRQWPLIHPCSVNVNIPEQVRNGIPLLPCLNQWDLPERHRQAVRFNAGGLEGDYFVFADQADLAEAGWPADDLPLRCSSRVIETVRFDDPEEKDRFRRVLAVCLFSSIENVFLVDFLFRLIRDALRSRAAWSAEMDAALRWQFSRELQVAIRPEITGERHACVVDWEGHSVRNCRDPVCCTERRYLLGDLGRGRGYRRLVDHMEASYWILRAARTTHPQVAEVAARVCGEGFPGVAEQDRRQFCRGPGWDGPGAGVMEVEGFNC